MAQISSSTGLVSGINYGDIINQLMSLEQRPVNTLQTRIDAVNQQKLAFTDLSTRLTSLKLNGTTLKKTASFQNATTTSSDENVLTATATSGAAVGSYQFQVARLVTTQQSVTRGFADFASAKVGAGTISIEMGGGELSQENALADLRGGAGISRGLFKITDRAGNTAVIDTTAAVNLDDVIKKINTSLDISVKASLDGDKIVIQDVTGKTASNLIIQDVGGGKSAADLGIVGNVASDSLAGSDINYLGQNTSLALVNDGRGVRTNGAGNDFAITLADGTTVNVGIATAKTIGDVINAINTAGGTNLKAEIDPGANGIKLTDLTSGGGQIQVTAIDGSQAASDLGIETTGAGGVINGSGIIAGLGTVLVSSLNGGQGLSLGTISVQSRAAGSGVDIDLSGAKTVADIINTINSAGAGVQASLNSAGNGIAITDTSGGTGNLVIGDSNGGTTATDLGLIGTYDINTSQVNGKNLQRQWVSDNTLLKDYNGGKGVELGVIRITNSAGAAVSIDFTRGNYVRLGDIIKAINTRDIGVTASINANGDGLLLTDSAGGADKLKVDDLSGSTAANLSIKGVATGTTLDGSQEKTITLTANDTLTTVQQKINDLGWGVSASVINDGSASAPYRLALNARNSGRDGRFVFDAGTTGLGAQTLVDAQDAAVFVGGGTSSQPLLITSSSNQISGVIKGVNISLNGVSDKPVTLNVSRNVDNVVDQLNKFTDTFNQMIDQIDTYTKWDTTTNTGGVLLGDSTTRQIQTEVYNMLNAVNPDAGKYRILADIGLTLGDGAKLQFDEEKFRAAYAADPDSVQNLFSSTTSVTKDGKTTSVTNGLGYKIETVIAKLIDPSNGVITQENNTLDQRTTQFQNRIDELNVLLQQKRTRLETQFANLESVLAGLQNQQKAIGQISTISFSSGK
jgi:flagellar hook-associated protein 2